MAPSWKGQFIVAGKTWWQECEGDGYTISTLRRREHIGTRVRLEKSKGWPSLTRSSSDLLHLVRIHKLMVPPPSKKYYKPETVSKDMGLWKTFHIQRIRAWEHRHRLP